MPCTTFQQVYGDRPGKQGAPLQGLLTLKADVGVLPRASLNSISASSPCARRGFPPRCFYPGTGLFLGPRLDAKHRD